jgi:general secretion pathway protein G
MNSIKHIIDPRLKYKAQLNRTSNEHGLTLIEIIVVLMLVGFISTFVVGKVFSAGAKAKAQLTRTKMNQIKGDINMYQLGNNALPASLQAADVSDSKDAWDKEISYRITNSNRSYELKSLGADGKEGGTGGDADIVITGP